MSHTKLQPKPQVMSQLEPELATWLLEDIPNNHWVKVCYQFPDVSPIPLVGVSYRIVSLQDENISVSGTLDSKGQAYHEGFVPGPVVVFLSTEDTKAVEMEVNSLQQNLQQSFDSLVMLLFSQKVPLDNNLQQQGLVSFEGHFKGSSAIVDAAVNKKPVDAIRLLSEYGDLSNVQKTSVFLLLSDDVFISMLQQFIEKLWWETDECESVRGYVSGLLSGLLIESLLGEGLCIASEKLSLLDYCMQLFSPIAPLLNEMVDQLRGLIPLFQQSKLKTTLKGRTNKETVVQWREPPSPQRCEKHYSNVALMPTNARGDSVTEGKESLVDGGCVHEGTGEVVLTHTDFVLNGPVPLQWIRHFRSSYVGGWCCIAKEAIHVSKGWVNYCREDGVVVSFELPPIGKYSTNVTCGLILQRVFYSVFVIKGQGEVQRVFSGLYSTTFPRGQTTNGRGLGTGDKEVMLEETIPLTQIKSRFSEGWHFDYNNMGHGHYQLVGVKSGWGHELAIEWSTLGFITRIVNKIDGKVLAQYDWSNNGLLSAIGSAGEHWQYTYLSADPMSISTMTHPNGVAVQWEYDTQGQLKTHASQRVKFSQLQYRQGESHNQSCDNIFHKGYENIFDKSYDRNHLLTSHKDIEGNVTQYRYNPEGLLTAFIDPAGGGFSLSYDDQNQLQEITNALGQSWGCEFNQQGMVEALVDPEGVLYRINCIAGKPVSMSVDIDHEVEVAPLLVQRYWQWDVGGNLIMDSANGRLNQATYDSYGKLIQLSDRGQEVLLLDYNSRRQLQNISAGGIRQLALLYHGSGMMQQITKASGQCVDLHFDHYGCLLGWKEKTATGKCTQSLSIQYDNQGRVLRLDSNGEYAKSLQFQYENGLLPSGCIDSSGNEFEFQFSKGGLLFGCESLGATWQYDACGRQVYRSSTKQEVKTQYDVLGRVVEHLEGSKFIQCEYQSIGLLSWFQSPLGKVEHAYDALGFRVSTTHSNGYVVAYHYSTPGMLERIEVNGNIVLEYIRDVAGVELYRMQGAYQNEGDTTAAHWVNACFDKKIEEVVERIRLQLGDKNQSGLMASLMLVLQLELLDFPPLLQQNIKGLQDKGNPMRGIANIPESSQIENGIVVHHPVSGEPLFVIYQNQVYFYENNLELKWRDWNGNNVTLNDIRVNRESLSINPLGDVDIKSVVKKDCSGMLWDLVAEGGVSTVMDALSMTCKSKFL